MKHTGKQHMPEPPREHLFFDLEVELLHDVATYHLPAEILEECRCLFLDLLFAELTVIDIEQPSLEELLRKLDVSFLYEILAQILGKLVVRLLLVILFKSCSYSLVEFLCIVNLVLTEILS